MILWSAVIWFRIDKNRIFNEKSFFGLMQAYKIENSIEVQWISFAQHSKVVIL